MNDEYSFPTQRRRFIKGSGTLVAMGSLPGYLAASTDALRETLDEIKQSRGIVLYRKNDLHSCAFARTLAERGIEALAMTDDLVRQWRDGLGQHIGKTGLPVMGLTNWADYLVIRGLAAEQRQHVMLELQHALEQPGRKDWASSLALEFTHLPENPDRQSLQAHFSRTLVDNEIKPGTRSAFSWLIA